MTPTLNPRLRFDSLVVGTANRLAATAARSVAEQPGAVYNPLLIYARPGLGKTHLLMAIGHLARELDASASVQYLTFDDFTEQYHAAVASGQAESWRQPFLAADVLLVDDVQFLAGRRELQAELLRLVDALQRENRQIVLTSDRPPGEIEQLDERLVRRFAGGLIVDIAPPDFETRVAILRRKADERRSSFLGGVLEEVARGSMDSVRELIGVFNKLVAMQAVTDTPISLEQARALVQATAPAALPTVPPPAPGAATEGVPAGPAAAAAEDVAALAAVMASGRDEFSDFLSDLTATLEARVEEWRMRVRDAAARYEAEGLVAARLRRLAEAAEPPVEAEEALERFHADAERLAGIRAEVAQLAPELAERAVLRDPDQLAAAEAVLEEARYRTAPLPAPHAALRLEAFTETAGTRVAVHAARAVGAEPAARYNPLVIVGPAGSGKTHLLHGIGNAIAATGVERVACLSAVEFSDQLIEAIDRDQVGAWRARMRRLGALLLDDVHVLAQRERTQEELFVLFNQLFERGTQLVFTATSRPASLAGLEPRLQSRLEGGLVVELTPPRAPRRVPGPGLPRQALASAEKVVLEWPDAGERLIEEWG